MRTTDNMDDATIEDETKPFDAEQAGHDDEAQPDPDEPLMMESGNGRVWLVKVYENYSHSAPFSLTQPRSRGI